MRTCFVPGCYSGYSKIHYRNKELGIRSPKMFLPPKDSILLKKWKIAIARGDKDLIRKKSCVVCERHFRPDEFIWYDEGKLKDGTPFRVKRCRPLLVPTAVPSLFLPRNNNDDENTSYDEMNCSENEESKKENSISQNKKLREHNLEEAIQKIKTPNKSWSVHCAANFILCAKWNHEFDVEKKVLIDEDLQLKVYIGEKLIEFRHKPLCDIEEICDVLKEVDSHASDIIMNDQSARS